MAMLLERLETLRELVDLAEGRVPEDLQGRARDVVGHASRRLAAGPQTVAALAGATGSGKSSLFNALTGTRLAAQGPPRPTTGSAMAASFAPTNADLLDLLEVSRRHEVSPPEPGLADLVLLDLPDHDSTATAHRDEVDRLVRLVDQFVWVLDPQKYADAAIHQRYLRPLARHRDVITVVLNQADRLPPDDLAACLDHLRRLLADDGLAGVPVLATSAVTGLGIADLRAHLAAVAEGKRAASARLAADVAVTARAYAEAVGKARPGQPSREAVAQLDAHLAASAGVPLVVDAVRASLRRRGRLAAGWPIVAWLRRLRPDPLKRLRLGSKPKPGEVEPGLTRSSLPARSAAAEAQLATGLRRLAHDLGEELPPLWRDAVHAAVHSHAATLPDALDRAVVGTDLKADRVPVWWRVVRGLQWLLIAAVLVGVAWLTANLALGYFGLPRLPTHPLGPEGGLQVPVPTALVVGGIVAGLGVSGLSTLAINAAADGAARRARKALTASVADVGRTQVVEPAEAELRRYAAARAALAKLD